MKKERDQDNRSQYNISDKSKDMVIIAISSKDRVTNTKECELLPNESADGDTKIDLRAHNAETVDSADGDIKTDPHVLVA